MFFENANSMVKVAVILWEIYWSYSFEKGLREELVDYFKSSPSGSDLVGPITHHTPQMVHWSLESSIRSLRWSTRA